MDDFARKLLQRPANIKIGVLGGSISAGYQPKMEPKTNYPEQLVQLLVQAFPSTKFELVNWGMGGTNPGWAALCRVDPFPANVDLMLLEYTVNGYTGICTCANGPYVAGLEALIRKLLIKYPTTPTMMFATTLWVGHYPQDMLAVPIKPLPFVYTGENLHLNLATYYGVPMVSVRDAMYRRLVEGTMGIRLYDYMLDRVHPNYEGTKLYAAMIFYAIKRRVLQTAAGLLPSEPDPGDVVPPLPPPVVVEAPTTGMCIASWEMRDFKFDAIVGFHDYARWGAYVGEASGHFMTFTINTEVAQEAGASSQVTFAIFFFRSWRGGMGKAWLECMSGCTCQGVTLDAHVPSIRTSEVTARRVVVTAHPRCQMRVTVSNFTSSGGYKFRWDGLAVYREPEVDQARAGQLGGQSYEILV